MAIYAGVGGVVREMEHFDIGRSGAVRHAYSWKAGVGGVVRNLTDITSQIDCVEINVDYVRTATVTSSGDYVSEEGTTLEIAQKYGSITIGSNYITVSCTTSLKAIDVDYTVYLVFKDGHKVMLGNAKSSLSEELTYTLNVYGYEYFRGNGAYINYCMGTAILENYVNNSASKTVNITDSTYSYGELYAERNASGTTTSQQRFNSITINGKSVPIKITNSLV